MFKLPYKNCAHVLSVLFCYYENYASKRAINYFAFLRYTTVRSLFIMLLQDKLAISEKQYTFSYLEKQIYNPFFLFAQIEKTSSSQIKLGSLLDLEQ